MFVPGCSGYLNKSRTYAFNHQCIGKPEHEQSVHSPKRLLHRKTLEMQTRPRCVGYSIRRGRSSDPDSPTGCVRTSEAFSARGTLCSFTP